MNVKSIFDRASYASDEQFERVVDRAIEKLDTDDKRKFMFLLMRECRGCGNTPTRETTRKAVVKARNGGFQHLMICKLCNRDVPIGRDELSSVGRLITLWNTTPLTIEGRARA